MELIPIVIAVLEIVTALAVITLLTSYIVYRIKLKNAPEKEEKPDLQPNFAFRSLNKLTGFSREFSHPHKQAPVPPIVAAPRPKPKPQKPIEKKHREPEKKEVRSQKPNIRREEPKHPRLQVMTNPISPDEERIERPNRRTSTPKRSANTLGDDVIGKYADDDHDDFVNLKIEKDNPKK